MVHDLTSLRNEFRQGRFRFLYFLGIFTIIWSRGTKGEVQLKINVKAKYQIGLGSVLNWNLGQLEIEFGLTILERSKIVGSESVPVLAILERP